MAPPAEELGWLVLVGLIVLVLVLLAIGKWYPGSGAEQLDWKPTRSAEQEVELELQDVDQMIEAQNARRRATGRPEITEDEVQERVAEDQRWLSEWSRRPDGE